MMFAILGLFGVLAGVTTVLFGFGGGFVVVPVMVAWLSVQPGMADSAIHVAVATSTCVMIVSAALSSWRHRRAATILWPQVRRLGPGIALGAAAGAALAVSMSGTWVRWAFIIYVLVTIVDCLLRPGFIRPARRKDDRPDGQTEGQTEWRTARSNEGATASFLTVPSRTDAGWGSALASVAMGLIAALLGVGGSVMTVPWLRRRGASMTQATATATPLTLPLAVAGTAAYVVLAWYAAPAHQPWHAGYVDLRAFVTLSVGAWVGLRLASPFIGRIPDRIHARVYVLLLAVSLLVMAWQ